MKIVSLRALLIAAIGLYVIAQPPLGEPAAQAQPRGGANGVRMDSVNGTIIAIDSIARAGSSPAVTYLIVGTPAETTTVVLGPTVFVKEQKLLMKVGDPVQAVGSRVVLEGRPIIVAREITAENKTVRLRGASGLPLWRKGSR